MKVLFINPQQEMGGIQCLSSFVEAAGHRTALVNDPNLFNNPWIQYPRLASWMENRDRLMSRIAGENPDLIALSAVTDDYPWALRWAREIKAKLGLPVVMGNAHPTFHPVEVLKESSVDFVVRGEGELTMLELMEAIERKAGYEKILGLGYRKNSAPVLNPMRPLIEDLDILPFPNKDLYYREMPYLNTGYTTMSGRGCPYRCSFCDNNTSAKLYRGSGIKQKWTRRHSPEYVVKEIQWAIQKYGIKHVRFNDEDFSYDKRWIIEFTEIYKDQVKIPYFAWVYPNTVDDEIARRLADSGCDSVEMGIQSGSERLRRDIMKRNTKDEQVVTAMRALRKSGIRATVDIILGAPSETKEDLDETIRLLLKGRPWNLYTFWLRYYPATEILQIAKEKKLLTQDEIERLERGQQRRGHISGGSELEKSRLTRSYHTFITLLPILPAPFVRFCLRFDLIQYTPFLGSPFILSNLTKVLKPDHYNEFRRRGWKMILFESVAAIANLGWNIRRATVSRLWSPHALELWRDGRK